MPNWNSELLFIHNYNTFCEGVTWVLSSIGSGRIWKSGGPVGTKGTDHQRDAKDVKERDTEDVKGVKNGGSELNLVKLEAKEASGTVCCGTVYSTLP